MDYGEIRRCLVNCRFSDHARTEMEAEPLASQTQSCGSRISEGGSGDAMCDL